MSLCIYTVPSLNSSSDSLSGSVSLKSKSYPKLTYYWPKNYIYNLVRIFEDNNPHLQVYLYYCSKQIVFVIILYNYT